MPTKARKIQQEQQKIILENLLEHLGVLETGLGCIKAQVHELLLRNRNQTLLSDFAKNLPEPEEDLQDEELEELEEDELNE